ncbi:Pimeloyl-ACP methyl ester carboxylesterase [Loktanella sp. DSM 29012]|uniref:alpha/beta fold hydrolase n=1 Tax=Loktanella sp. DSM 29012 TaxID=1881056 RepID=UPI0008D27285|nr:alpha/beta fold hydrolase [Loktanella sp. DSM 29012]SEP99767.1 Pimeloyl-ACP methyl ester carboxylesterase [Loktanella sp. DSM 29012]
MPEPIVFLPPMLCDARAFAHQIMAFSATSPVMCLPTGLADTMEQIAREILTQAPPRFALAGLSMGGCIALEVVRQAPGRVTRLALINTTAQSELPEIAAAREPRIVAARAGRFCDVVHAELPPSAIGQGPYRSDTLDAMGDMARDVGADAYVMQARAMQRRPDQTPTLRKMRQPTLVLSGGEDTVYPLRRQQFMAELIPYAQHRVIAGAGHLPTLEAPQAAADALRDWMQQPLVLR